MADRAASSISIRYGDGPIVKVKVTSFQFDPEVRTRRALISGQIPEPASNPTLCKPFTVVESSGGMISCRGFVDPSDDFTADLISTFWYADESELTASEDYEKIEIEFYLDLNETTGSRHGFRFGESPFITYAPPNYWAPGVLIPGRFTGETDDNGMLEVEFEIHSQLGVKYHTNL